MKAAVLLEPGRLQIEERDPPRCPPGGIVVEVKACGVCSTDARMARFGQRDLACPRVLGHEIAGVVVESDAGLPALRPGARVHVAPGVPCGECPACRRGADNRCERIGIFGFTLDGGFAERVAVPNAAVDAGGVTPLPDDLPFEAAALAEPLACCLNAQERAGVGPGDAVLVVGAGPAGCLHVMLARSRGAARVFVAEPLPARRSAARRAGADLAGEEAEIRRALRRDAADVIIWAARDASPAAWLPLLRSGGRACLFSGLPADRETEPVNLNRLHYRELQLVGAYGCTIAQNRAALDWIARRPAAALELITLRAPLEDIRRGLDHVERREGQKAVVTPS